LASFSLPAIYYLVYLANEMQMSEAGLALTSYLSVQCVRVETACFDWVVIDELQFVGMHGSP